MSTTSVALQKANLQYLVQCLLVAERNLLEAKVKFKDALSKAEMLTVQLFADHACVDLEVDDAIQYLRAQRLQWLLFAAYLKTPEYAAEVAANL